MTDPERTLASPSHGSTEPPEHRYRPGEQLGRGGMGVVVRASDQALRRPVAMKLLQPGQDSQRFLQEAQITAQLEHPNIVPVHDLGLADEGIPYFTMKLVSGRTLSETLSRTHDLNLPLRPLFEILVKVCDALAFAHSRGVLHRDLKPANIMVGEFGEVLLMDWGLAKVKDRPDLPSEELVRTQQSESDFARSVDGDICGTPSYLSPEQARGDVSAVDQRTDVYALGAILYQIVTGVPPAVGKSLQDILLRARTSNFPSPIDYLKLHPKRWSCPPEINAIALKALSNKPADRYPSVTAFQEDLQRYLEGASVSARPDSASATAGKWLRRHPWVLALPVLAALGLYAGMRISEFQQRRQRMELSDEARAFLKKVPKDPDLHAAAPPADQSLDAILNLMDAESLLRQASPESDELRYQVNRSIVYWAVVRKESGLAKAAYGVCQSLDDHQTRHDDLLNVIRSRCPE
jgi:serine/threonine protein kinase